MKRLAFLMFLGIAALIAACSTNGTNGEIKENQPPTVWLAAGPPEGSTGKYRVQMFWGGWDPDGEIGGYEYIVTDNETGTFNPADTVGVPWSPVGGNDSIFVFSADIPVDSLNDSLIEEFTRSHTFFIRAIDEVGLRSRTPAHRSFTSRTLSPEVRIQIPRRNEFNPALVPPITTFRWLASDPVDDMLVIQEPDSVQWALVATDKPGIPGGGNATFEEAVAYLLTPAGAQEWYPWAYYRAPEDSGKSWTSPPLDPGPPGAGGKTYVFAIRAKDEAGAITPVLDEGRNWRRLKVTSRNRGPLMTVSNEYLGLIQTVVCNTPLTILDSPASVPLGFRITANAEDYGGTVSGYRYGWDIPDLSDPEQWEIDLTPFPPSPDPEVAANVPPRPFFFGTHTLTMEVVDNSGYCSRVQVKVNIVQFTLDRSLLVVDDDFTDDASTGWASYGHPVDADHDAFWRDMVSEVAGFDPEIDMVDTKLKFLPLTQLAQYKSIIWSTVGDPATAGVSIPALLYSFIKHRPKELPPGQQTVEKAVPNVLALAMAAGGHIMIAGKHPIQFVINRNFDGNRGLRYPAIWLWDLEAGQETAPTSDEEPVGDLSFAYRELCLETMDYAFTGTTRWRPNAGSNRLYCPSQPARAPADRRTETMREALSLDPHFPTLGLRPEAAGPGAFYPPDVQGLDVEVYNPFYYQKDSGRVGACAFVDPPRPCFQPVWGLGCLNTAEATYNQPIAFWTSAFADRIADVPGAVAARSIVFGFPPVFLNPGEFQPVMDHILFDEWQLPRGANATATVGAAGSGASPE